MINLRCIACRLGTLHSRSISPFLPVPLWLQLYCGLNNSYLESTLGDSCLTPLCGKLIFRGIKLFPSHGAIASLILRKNTGCVQAVYIFALITMSAVPKCPESSFNVLNLQGAASWQQDIERELMRLPLILEAKITKQQSQVKR